MDLSLTQIRYLALLSNRIAHPTRRLNKMYTKLHRAWFHSYISTYWTLNSLVDLGLAKFSTETDDDGPLRLFWVTDSGEAELARRFYV